MNEQRKPWFRLPLDLLMTVQRFRIYSATLNKHNRLNLNFCRCYTKVKYNVKLGLAQANIKKGALNKEGFRTTGSYHQICSIVHVVSDLVIFLIILY